MNLVGVREQSLILQLSSDMRNVEYKDMPRTFSAKTRITPRLTTKRICNTMYDILRELDVDNMSIALVSGRS